MKPKYKEWIGKWFFPTRKGEWGNYFVFDAKPVSPGSNFFEISTINNSLEFKKIRLSRRSFQIYYEKTEYTSALNRDLIETIFRRSYELTRGLK